MAINQPVATVVAVIGEAYARNADGAMRVLKAGDALFEGEVVITRNGGRVELATSDGQLLEVQPNETIAITAELSDTTRPTPQESAVGDATIDRVIQAINDGGDIDEAVDAPAAGLNGGAGGEGNSFVRLLRITEGVDPLDFEFGAARTAPEFVFDGGTGDETADTADITDVVTPPAPTVSIPDTDGALNTTDSTIAESAGATGGNFTLSAPAGLSSITVGGTPVTLADLNALGTTPVSINTGEGTLVLTSYNPGTGVVSYTYDPNVQDHSAGSVVDAIPVSVVDALGRTVSDVIDIQITDSVPVAVNDTNSIFEDASPNTVSGSVLTNDTVGADANATPITAASPTLAYGTLVLNADGS
ncbi:retention module-containing protein, partial [Zoogloeaceae bacterium G21618-S1]|nr:retention module-containing protein [Zoogloeaceae bacterium G21618-S1]